MLDLPRTFHELRPPPSIRAGLRGLGDDLDPLHHRPCGLQLATEPGDLRAQRPDFLLQRPLVE